MLAAADALMLQGFKSVEVVGSGRVTPRGQRRRARCPEQPLVKPSQIDIQAIGPSPPVERHCRHD